MKILKAYVILTFVINMTVVFTNANSQTHLNEPDGMVFVNIPQGTFEMGDHYGIGEDHEKPIHAVSVSAFQLSKYEVTNAQYVEYLNSAMDYGLIKVLDGMVYASSDGVNLHYLQTSIADNISQISFADGRFNVLTRSGFSMADHPVVAITYYGAKAFCDFYGYRLPTEAEWEYAARGGFHTPYFKYPWGSNSINTSQLNFGRKNPLGLGGMPLTTPVDYYPTYGYGLCSMAGNVTEWCHDWWDQNYYESSPSVDPIGPSNGSSRVLRGGCWGFLESNECRIPGRGSRSPDWYCPYGAVGFRPALDMPGISSRKPGLIANWEFDEFDGIIAKDSLGDHDATVIGDVVWQHNGGIIGGALELDGVDDAVLTNIILNPENKPFSIFAWIRGGAPGQVIVSQQALVMVDQNYHFNFSWLALDSVLGTLTTDLASLEPTISAPDIMITDNQWHRVGLVWDKSSQNSTLYVDDVEVAVHTEPRLPMSVYGGLQISVGKNGEFGNFSGLIDDVQIYKKALSAEEIATLTQ